MADYYPDSGGDEDQSKVQSPKSKVQDEDSQPQGETTLIPKSLLAGKEFEPGEEVVFKIVAMRGDEVEVEYATEDGESPKSEVQGPKSGDSPEMAGAMEKMGSYAE